MAEEIGTNGKEAAANLSFAEKRAAGIVGKLGATEGWEFVAYVKYNGFAHCEASNGRMSEGVRLHNTATDVTMTIGRGVAEKYLPTVELPRKTAGNTVTEDAPVAPAKPAAPSGRGRGRPRKEKAEGDDAEPEVQEDTDVVVGIDLDELAAMLAD
jgi:hypothetical protein